METELWINVYHGFRLQWSDPVTWLVLGVALSVTAPVAWLLTHRRRWPSGSTAATVALVSFYFASTWRVQGGARPKLDGLGQFGSQLWDSGAWHRGLSELAALGPFVVANIVFLVPLGFFLLLAGRPRWVGIPILVGAVLLVETGQSVVYGGSITDILANLLGGAIGFALGLLYLGLRRGVRRGLSRGARVRRMRVAIRGPEPPARPPPDSSEAAVDEFRG